MFITTENNKTLEIKSIDEPMTTDYFWVCDLIQHDFMLSKLIMLEEFNAPMLTLSIRGKLVDLPAEWNILVYSPDTSEVDMVQVSDLTKSDFTIFLYDHKNSKVIETNSKIINYVSTATIRTPSFNKNNMLCHPVGDNHWIMVAPTDTFNKYLKDSVTVGNFLY